MIENPDLWIPIAARLLGAIAGTILALVFMPPHHRAEGHRRAVFSGISGMVFASYSRGFVGFSDDLEGLIAGACTVAALSWWIMGALQLAISYLPNRVKRK